jgi:oligoendopeptidase F
MAQAVATNRAMSGSDISRSYLALLHVYYEDPDIDIDPLFAEQWMSYPFIFDSRHILPEWAMAVAAGADLEARIQARTAEAMATVGAPLAKPSSFTSHDLLRDVGINIETDAPYEALIRKMTSDMNRLERELMH